MATYTRNPIGPRRSPAPPIGKLTSSATPLEALSYRQLMGQLAAVVSTQIRDVDDRLRAVATFATAFDDFNELSVGRQLDEEGLTAAFLGHLSSSARHVDCLHPRDDGGPARETVRWLHYGKTAEAIIGADFALFIPVVGSDKYRLMVFQAKKQGASRVDVARAPRWHTSRAPKDLSVSFGDYLEDVKVKEEHARKNGDDFLMKMRRRWSKKSALSAKENEDITEARLRPQWQLTKLLMLGMQLRGVAPQSAAIGVYYVVWPTNSGNAPWYAPLDATTVVPGEMAESGKILPPKQSIPAHKLREDLRALLVSASLDRTSRGLTIEEAAEAYKIVAPDTVAVAILDIGAPDAAPALERHLVTLPGITVRSRPTPKALPPFTVRRPVLGFNGP